MNEERIQATAEVTIRLERALRLSEALIAIDGTDKDDIEHLIREALAILNNAAMPKM